jgi:ATP-dependent DNA helicase HFM1/MER3
MFNINYHHQLLNRNPPFGDDILSFVRGLPQYHLSIEESNVITYSGHRPAEVELKIACGATFTANHAMKSKKSKKGDLGMTTILTFTSDLNYIDFRRIPFVCFIFGH